MSESSREIIYIPTKWPFERLKIRKTFKKMDIEELDDKSIDIWCKRIIEKYEDRPQELSHVSLAEFVSCFTFSSTKKKYILRQKNRIICYRNYDISDITNYKREMVTLYYPFRNEEVELLDNDKFLEIYNNNELKIMEVQQKFEKYIDIQKTIDYCKKLCLEIEEESEIQNEKNEFTISKRLNDEFLQSLKAGT